MKINYIAPLNSLGYGTVALNILKAAVASGHEIACWPIGGGADAPPEDHQLLREAFDKTKFFDRTAPCLRVFHQFSMAEMVGKGLHCGFPIFELDRFTPQELHHLKSLDIVFVASSWATNILRQNGIATGVVAPFGVDRTIFNESPPSRCILPTETGAETFIVGHPDETIFLNIGKWEYRKGHDILCAAFNKAFTPKDNVRLIMCCHNPFLQHNGGNDQWKRYYTHSRMGQAEKITILSERLSSQHNLAALIHRTDCGVYPSRAEGWGMGSMETLSCGKTIIITSYSAHTEYCTSENARLIPITETEQAQDGIWFHGQGNWAQLNQPQLDCLVEHLREVHRLKQSGNLKRNDAGIETAKRFTWQKTVSHIVSALQ